MRTNIVLDPKLIKEAQSLTGIKEKKALVHEALRTLIKVKRKKPISELFGKIKFQDNYNYKKLRES